MTTPLPDDNSNTTNLTFAVIPKNTDNVFFSVVRDGCVARAAQLSNVNCLYVGPRYEDPIQQASTIDAIINGTYGQIDGISISVSDIEIITTAISRAVNSGIPVITFDSDAQNSLRKAYIGTDNYSFGVELGKLLHQLAPRGGTYGIIGGSAPNIQDRVEGVRDRLADSKWIEVTSSYKDSLDSTSVSLDLMYEYSKEHVDAIIPVGGWPMFGNDPQPWKDFVDDNRNMTLIVADTLPQQIELMNQGYVNGLVGQLPYQMGEQSIDILHKISEGYEDDVKGVIFGTAFLEVIRFPLVLPDLTINENYLEGLHILGYFLFVLIASISIGLSIWVFVKRKTRVVKASQPFFLQMIIIGILIFSSAMVPLAFDNTRHSQKAADASCMAVPWLMTIGFTTIFSALFAKTWRVNKIFHNPNMFKRIKVTAFDVMKPYFIMMTMNLIVLTCWTTIAPLTYQRFNSDGTDEWNRVIETYGVCTSKSDTRDATSFFPYVIVLLIINISLLIIANVQSYRARTIQTEFSESKYITIIMASMLQVMVIGIPCICLLWNIPRAYFVVMVLLISCVSLAVLGFMFLPKIVHTKRWLKEKEEKKHTTSDRAKVSHTVRFAPTPGTPPTHSIGDGADGLKIAVMEKAKYVGSYSNVKVSNTGNTASAVKDRGYHNMDEEKQEEGIDIQEATPNKVDKGTNELDDIQTLDEALEEIKKLREKLSDMN